MKRSGLLSQSLYMSVRSATNEPFGTRPCCFSQAFRSATEKAWFGSFGEIGRVVEHDQRQDHLLERDLVHGDAVLVEMRRRIDMGAILPDHVVIGGAEAILLDGVGPLVFGSNAGVNLAWPKPDHTGVVGAEAVGEIDEFLLAIMR